MKTFKQFLLESQPYPNPEEFAGKLLQECTQFLTESGFNPEDADGTGIIRGSEQAPVFTPLTTPTSRRPLTSSADTHYTVDTYLKKQFGTPFRSHSIFVCRDMDTVINYGSPFMIFPIGDFKYCWSPKIDDLFYYITNIDTRIDMILAIVDTERGTTTLSTRAPERAEKIRQFKKQGKNAEARAEAKAMLEYLNPDDLDDIMRDWLYTGNSEYRTDGLREAIRKYPKNEIMIADCKYYALPWGENGSEGRDWTEKVFKSMKSL